MAIDFNDPEAVRLYVADLEERDRKRQRLHEEEIAILEGKVVSLQEEKEEGAYLREEKEEAVQKINALVQENQGLKLETKTAKRETEEVKREIEGSPLLKYMNLSGKTVCKKLVIEQNPLRRTTGASVTKIDGKVYPHDVKPWKGFLDKQKVNFEAVCQAFPPDYCGFYCSKTLDDIGKQSVKPIANEPEVSDFISINIEDPVTTILEKLKSLDPDGKVCRINGRIDFRRTAYDVNEPNAGGLAGRRESMAKLQPDRFCVCFKQDLSTGSTTLLYVCEFKPPWGCTNQHFLDAFQPTANVKETLLNNSFEDAKGTYALVQIYHYIMDSGTRYGILNTGEIIIFLYVDPKKPRTLQYHILQPLQDISAEGDEKENAFMSVIGQYLAFTIMVLKAHYEPGQEERLRILNSLPRWKSSDSEYVPEDENSFSGPPPPQVEGASAGSSSPEDGQGAS
ncbi:hypothetical protein E4U13_007031, partial [Claviceps humidiphila]